MCIKTVGGRPQRITTTISSPTFHPTSEWMPVANTTDVVFNLYIQGLIGGLKVEPAYQLATVRPDNPSLPQGIGTTGSLVSTEGYHYSTKSMANKLDAVMFWRFGVEAQATASFGQADIALSASFDHSGALLGRRSFEMNPLNNNNQASVFPFTPWRPMVSADKVKAAFVIADNLSNSLRYKLWVRTADDRRAPNPWAQLETGWVTPNTPNSERNTGALLTKAVTAGSLFQLGVAVSRNGSNASRATIHAAAASWS